MSASTQDDRFKALLLEHGAAIRRLASAYERDPDLQKDLFQEIALALWRALPGFRGECSERTFLYRIAHNRALTHRAKYRPKHRPEQLDISEAQQLADSLPDPEQAALIRGKKAALAARVAILPLSLRQVVALALEGLSHNEIADVLGISPANVAVRMSRAKKQLKEGER